MQLYRRDHKYCYQVMHSYQESDAAEYVSSSMFELFVNGGVLEGDGSFGEDQIVPFVFPIFVEENKKT